MDHWLAQCVHHWQVGGVVFDMAEGLLGIVSSVVGTFGRIVGVTVRALDFALGFAPFLSLIIVFLMVMFAEKAVSVILKLRPDSFMTERTWSQI